MRRTVGFTHIVLLSLSLFGLLACSLFNKDLVILCTDRPEIAAYVETFNALSPEIQIEIHYKEEPVRSLFAKDEPFDLILSAGLSSRSALQVLEPLDSLFKDEQLDRARFYQGLLKAGVYEEKQLLLPLSFNLPTMVFHRDSFDQAAQKDNDPESLPNLVIPLDFINTQGAAFNQLVRSSFKRMGFSPLWDHNFLYMGAVLLGAGFREEPLQDLSFDEDGLNRALQYLKTWVDEANGGPQLDEAFVQKYMYEPVSKLLDEKRILFYYTSSERLLQALEEHQEEVDFRWLTHGEEVVVEEEILYLGIPRAAGNKRGARIFLEWLFDQDTQELLLRINQAKRLKVFGIAGGFSALREVNEQSFPRAYPKLIGRIPSALRFPGHLPLDWAEIKRQVILPWLLSTITADSVGTGQRATAALRAALAAFRREQP